MVISKEKLTIKLQEELEENILELSHLFIPKNPKAPHIYHIKTSNGGLYVVKVLYRLSTIVGEEDAASVILDYFVSDFLYSKHVYSATRSLVSYFPLNSSYEVIVSTYINGNPIDNNKDYNLLSSRYKEVLQHLNACYTKQDLISYLDANANFWNSYKTVLEGKFTNIESISFLKHFNNDIKRTDLDQELKNDLLEWLIHYNYCDSCIERQLIHGDLKHKNIILTPGEKLVPIDWSAAHVGCPAIDIADILVASRNFTDVSGTLKMLSVLANDDLTSKYFNAKSVELVKVYLLFKIFSISRVWNPEFLEDTAKEILTLANSDLEGVLQGFLWLFRRRY